MDHPPRDRAFYRAGNSRSTVQSRRPGRKKRRLPNPRRQSHLASLNKNGPPPQCRGGARLRARCVKGATWNPGCVIRCCPCGQSGGYTRGRVRCFRHPTGKLSAHQILVTVSTSMVEGRALNPRPKRLANGAAGEDPTRGILSASSTSGKPASRHRRLLGGFFQGDIWFCGLGKCRRQTPSRRPNQFPGGRIGTSGTIAMTATANRQ